MTKTRYDGAQFDDFAARLWELACDLKAFGRTVRDEQLTEFELHDRKPKEWLGKLEAWVSVARRRLREESLRQQGSLKAQEFLARERSRQARKRKEIDGETSKSGPPAGESNEA